MGAFFSSIQVRGENRAAVKAAVAAIASESGKEFLLGPVLNGWIGVYPEDSNQEEHFAAALSRQLDAIVLRVAVHDSSVLFYHLFHRGELLNEYSSKPDYFGETSAAEHERLKAQPGLFQELVASPEDFAKLARLLERGEGALEFVFEEQRLEEFAVLLGIRNALTSFEYMTQGERDGLKGWKQFIHVPDQSDKKAAKKAAKAALRAEKQRLQKAGLLCIESLPPGRKSQHLLTQCEFHFEPPGGGLLVCWIIGPHPQWIRLQSPWTSRMEVVAAPTVPFDALTKGQQIHPSKKFSVTRPSETCLGIINLESGIQERVLSAQTKVALSGLFSHIDGEFKKAGLGEEASGDWEGKFVELPYKILDFRFSPDGRLLFCATTVGLRVLAWSDLSVATERVPEPLFAVIPCPTAAPFVLDECHYANYIYNVVSDEANDRLLFCGIEGLIRFLNLKDGSSGILLDPPGKSPMWQLRLSPDRQFVCCLCLPTHEERDKESPRLQVWNYPALCQAVGLDWAANTK